MAMVNNQGQANRTTTLNTKFTAKIRIIVDSTKYQYRKFGISKRGDVYLRTLMIHGARSVVASAKHKDDPLSRWVTEIARRRHPNVAAVALANKNARMAWAILRNKTDYDPDVAMS